MKRIFGIASLLCATILFASAASAAPVVYTGYLSPGAVGTDSVPTGNGWINSQGTQVDFWEFGSVGGELVTVMVHPLNAGLDPAFSVYMGTTSADTSEFSNFSDWGGMTFVDFGATLTGAGQDAIWSFMTPEFSRYTIAVGGWDSVGNGPFAYEITVTGNTPEPATLALMAVGLAGVAFSRRRSLAKKQRRLSEDSNVC